MIDGSRAIITPGVSHPISPLPGLGQRVPGSCQCTGGGAGLCKQPLQGEERLKGQGCLSKPSACGPCRRERLGTVPRKGSPCPSILPPTIQIPSTAAPPASPWQPKWGTLIPTAGD